MSHLLTLADNLMTTPITTLEWMYNESLSRSSQDEKYKTICKLILQVADKRLYTLKKDEDKNRYLFIHQCKINHKPL